ncbi:MAG: carboxypeptidase regulatory-like domain-containing protein [Myxococcales bacterium]|nr:carboxypeptidase regulatory-like domain-containing protein [Myxococcales bacterium]
MKRAIAIAALLLFGCGQIENDPLRHGTVRGTVLAADPKLALVAVFGKPELRSRVSEDGSFEIEGVPAGGRELFVVASASSAVLSPVAVRGGGVARADSLVAGRAAFIDLELDAPSGQRVNQGEVTVVGTPYAGIRLDDDAVVRLGPLPAGCYQLSAAVRGMGDVSGSACVAEGELRSLSVGLAAPDGTEGREGCLVTGCEAGLRCAPDGSCVACLEDGHCPSGLSCSGNLCLGDVGLCSACTDSGQCGKSGVCESLSGSEGKVCLPRYENDSCGVRGFEPRSSRCEPMRSQFDGCYAFRHLGSPCSGDEVCRGYGLLNGVCMGGSCTYRCGSNDECPAGFDCREESGQKVCRRS